MSTTMTTMIIIMMIKSVCEVEEKWMVAVPYIAPTYYAVIELLHCPLDTPHSYP